MFENVRPQVIKKAALVLQDSEVYQHCQITLDFHREKNSTDNNNDNSSEKNSSENINNVDDIEDNLSDDNSEEEEPVNIEDESTLLMTQAIVFAPGEGQLPVSLFDKYTEALSFLKIYGGKLIKKPEHITYQNWIKSEIMRSDRRCATIIKLFFSALKLRTSKIASKYHEKNKICSDEEDDNDDLIDNSVSLKLIDNSGFVRKRKKSKIIRFINYNEQVDKDNFIRENVIRSEYVYNENIENILHEAIQKIIEFDNENEAEKNIPRNLEVFDDPTHEGDIAIDMNENGAKNKKKVDDNKDVYYTSIPRLISEEDFINLKKLSLSCYFIHNSESETLLYQNIQSLKEKSHWLDFNNFMKLYKPCIFIAAETWIKIKDDITVPGYEIVYRVNVAKTRL
ncbi:Protein of unknown function [Cotesia congregata]|uniref:Uncharacterized protein n=1 Tax=Cotesia congregata TaxID=51543 RepID=A0A8J2HFY6_COTCN|nr:Protein of unknown function [Cotesia congregata]